MARQSQAVTKKLKEKLDGKVSFAGDARYETVRTVWSAMIDRHPAGIVPCAGTEDVARHSLYGDNC